MHVFIDTSHVFRYLQSSREAFRSPRIEVAGMCELSSTGAGTELRSSAGAASALMPLRYLLSSQPGFSRRISHQPQLFA